MLLRYYQRLLDTCVPYVIAREAIRPGLDLAPFRLEVSEDCRFDPMHAASGPFIDLVKRLDDAGRVCVQLDGSRDEKTLARTDGLYKAPEPTALKRAASGLDPSTSGLCAPSAASCIASAC